jgi:type IV pilus assembly protein PilE
MEMIRQKASNSTQQTLQGMTLLELLVTVAIIGILAAVIYPSYTKHIQASHRATAKADLIKLQLYLEQSYDANSTDSNVKGGYDHGIISASQCATDKVNCDSEASRYDFKITPLVSETTSSGYVLTASAKGSQIQDDSACNSITLKSNGQVTPDECW